MKGNRNPAPPVAASSTAPQSPSAKGTAKYTNKDGSKFITVPKGSTPVESSQPSPTCPSPPQPAPPAVNRKKQKRREKAAAKAAAEQKQQAQTGQQANGTRSGPNPPQSPPSADVEQDEDDEEADAGPDSVEQNEQPPNGTPNGQPAKSKKAKKKKKKNNNAAGASADGSVNGNHVDHRPPPTAHTNGRGMSKEKIWNTSSQEERERIKEFWLGLDEVQRKNLVKVEKDAVLKKMKEQQKQTCSCSVCGRKRTAIEEELEGLYDAYYEELEHYANHPHTTNSSSLLSRHHSISFASIPPNLPHGLPTGGPRYTHQPSHGRILEHVDDDADDDEEGEGEEGDYEGEDGEEEYSDEELEDEEDDDEEYSDDEHDPSELHRTEYSAEFFNFGNSLTVQGRDRLPILPSFLQTYPYAGTGNNAYGSSSIGGILTVADDLLKNDGRKFIEMMEQLAERRMASQERVLNPSEQDYDHTNGDRYGHNHPPPPDPDDEEEEYEEDEDYEEDEEEYDSQEEEEDPMTDEQRMEEGRRMFQIFAARMFEQRVLTAYREKVAKERQAKLLEEIEAENQQDAQRKAKKAKEAQRRKDRAARKKEALAEEKARKEAEKAAEEAARKEEEERKQAEAKQRAEEKRKRREAQKKAEEEERLRKEAERQRKIHEREENERKAREAKEREKKAREEARLKEKEQKEREARERREQQEREKRDKEAKAKAERESREQAKEIKEKRKKEERAAQKAATLAAAAAAAASAPSVTLPKRPAQQQATVIPALAQSSASFASPQITVATPALPKAPTPVRPRQPSQQENTGIQTSGAGFPPGIAPSHSQSPLPITPIQASPGPIGPPSKSGLTGSNLYGGQASSHAASPLSAQPIKPLPMHPNPFGMPMGGGGGMPFPPGLGQMPPPGFGNPMHRDPPFSPMNAFRPPPGIVSLPPGLSGPGPNRGFPLHQHHPPGFPGPLDSPVPPMAHLMGPSGMQRDSGTTHSRQGSGSYESGGPQPISKPTPIGRPASVVHGQRPSSSSPSGDFSRHDMDHLGSSALLDDGDDPIDFAGRPVRLPTASSLPRPGGFGAFGMDPIFGSHPNPWAPPTFGMPPQSHPFPPGPPPGFGGPSPIASSWGPPPGVSFSIPGVLERPTEARHLTLRKMLRKACEDLGEHDTQAAEGRTGFIPLVDIKAQVDRLHINGPPVTFDELLMICETEGNEVNGGGIFELREENGNKSIQYFLNNDRARPQGVLKTVGYHPGSPTGGGGLGH
ncbi:salt tolerance down-regulator-domain-containing protein [Cercophora samala]|uniref:Stress response protein NST1 n=1 Tax=Cercophora samala TaxID=330535 RepID=A0AA40DE16_9PEZI|nr:salt tolerance down-regulator-domain-containing protein [Cercophora samala]